MAVMANMTVADGATTPVSHVFSPVSDSPAEWLDTDAAKAYKHLQYRVFAIRKPANGPNGVNRLKLVLNLPTGGDGVSLPANEVSRSHNATVEFLMPAKGIKQERKDLRTLTRNLLADAQVIDLIDELNSAW